MRAPRYRFPDEVRSTTRTMASRMMDDGEVAETPEQLDAWISQRPEVRESLERGGYGTEFTAHDLFPLLQAMIGRAGGPAPEVVGQAGGSAPNTEAPSRSSNSRWLVVLLLVLVVAVVLLAVAMSARP